MICRFCSGGGAHTPDETRGLKRKSRNHIDILGLTEENKLPFVRENMTPAEE